MRELNPDLRRDPAPAPMRKKIVKKAPNEPVLAARVPDHQEVAPVQAEGLREGV